MNRVVNVLYYEERLSYEGKRKQCELPAQIISSKKE